MANQSTPSNFKRRFGKVDLPINENYRDIIDSPLIPVKTFVCQCGRNIIINKNICDELSPECIGMCICGVVLRKINGWTICATCQNFLNVKKMYFDK